MCIVIEKLNDFDEKLLRHMLLSIDYTHEKYKHAR